MKWSKLAAAVVALGVAVAGCAKAPSDIGRAVAGGRAARKGRTAIRLKWNRNTLVKAYDTFGKHSPKWDKEARKSLEAFAEMRSHFESFTEIPMEVLDPAHAAVTNGCDDPLVRYFNMRWKERVESLQRPEMAANSIEVVDAFEKTAYPPIRKFYANLRASELVAEPFGGKAIDYLVHALKEKGMPIEEVYIASQSLLDDLQHSERLKEFHDRAVPILMTNWPNASETWLLKGRFFLAYAWQARGDGMGDTITEAGARLFEERLDQAQNALTNAWRINPHDARIPVLMIDVELGQGKGRERMEMWFARAMEADTNCYDACCYKLNYLQPKWYGSAQAMIEFGHECVTNRSWGPTIPLALANAHELLAESLDASERGSYWKDPAVWNDIKSAYEEVFARTNDVSYRKKFLQYALRAGDMSEVNRQLAILEKIDQEQRLKATKELQKK